jgi:hypothetical protein
VGSLEKSAKEKQCWKKEMSHQSQSLKKKEKKNLKLFTKLSRNKGKSPGK